MSEGSATQATGQAVRTRLLNKCVNSASSPHRDTKEHDHRLRVAVRAEPQPQLWWPRCWALASLYPSGPVPSGYNGTAPGSRSQVVPSNE